MVATHYFHELVFSARLFMKKASLGYCVLVFDSSGEPAVHLEISDSCALGCSGTEFEVGRTASCEEVIGATVNAPMDYESSMSWFNFSIGQDLGRSSSLLFFRSVEFPVADFREGNISTEAERKSQRRSRSAGISRRLVPLARNASASIDFSYRDHSRTLLEQAFDDGRYHLK